MKQAKISIFLFLSIFFIQILSGQTAAVGTYQLLYLNDPASASVSLTQTDLQRIEILRKPNVPVYVRYSETVVIKILSADKIQAPDFTPPSATAALNEDSDLRFNRYEITGFWETTEK